MRSDFVFRSMFNDLALTFLSRIEKYNYSYDTSQCERQPIHILTYYFSILYLKMMKTNITLIFLNNLI